MARLNLRSLLLACTVTILPAGGAFAALVNRGGGMIYDDTLNITWLYDWNYAKTSYFDADGYMNWTTANDWANSLVFGGFSDWRLPTVAQPDTSCSDNSTNVYGLHYFGFNCTGGEMGHLFYTDLGGHAGQSVLDSRGDTAQESANRLLFVNVQTSDYWSGTRYAPNVSGAWVFSPYTGNQFAVAGFGFSSEQFRAMAVRPGDVIVAPPPPPPPPPPVPGQVPEPSGLLLVGAALGAVAMSRRRSLKSSRLLG